MRALVAPLERVQVGQYLQEVRGAAAAHQTLAAEVEKGMGPLQEVHLWSAQQLLDIWLEEEEEQVKPLRRPALATERALITVLVEATMSAKAMKDCMVHWAEDDMGARMAPAVGVEGIFVDARTDYLEGQTAEAWVAAAESVEEGHEGSGGSWDLPLCVDDSLLAP